MEIFRPASHGTSSDQLKMPQAGTPER
jgi:hypothetical protein